MNTIPIYLNQDQSKVQTQQAKPTTKIGLKIQRLIGKINTLSKDETDQKRDSIFLKTRKTIRRFKSQKNEKPLLQLLDFSVVRKKLEFSPNLDITPHLFLNRDN